MGRRRTSLLRSSPDDGIVSVLEHEADRHDFQVRGTNRRDRDPSEDEDEGSR